MSERERCCKFHEGHTGPCEHGSETVYERARLCLRSAGWYPSRSRIVDEYGMKQIFIALDAGEAAEQALKKYQDCGTGGWCQEVTDRDQRIMSLELELNALKARVAELEPAYLLEKERRIAAEKEVAESKENAAHMAIGLRDYLHDQRGESECDCMVCSRARSLFNKLDGET